MIIFAKVIEWCIVLNYYCHLWKWLLFSKSKAINIEQLPYPKSFSFNLRLFFYLFTKFFIFFTLIALSSDTGETWHLLTLLLIEEFIRLKLDGNKEILSYINTIYLINSFKSPKLLIYISYLINQIISLSENRHSSPEIQIPNIENKTLNDPSSINNFRLQYSSWKLPE